MLKMAAKKMNGTSWDVLECPEMTTERVQFIKDLQGRDAVIELKTSKQTVYVCCSDVTLQIMKTAFEGKKVAILDSVEAIKMYEHMPEELLITLQCYWAPEHDKILFPPKPEKGWAPPA